MTPLRSGSFHFKDGELFCENVNLNKLTRTIKEDNVTPCYVYSKYSNSSTSTFS